MASKVRNTLSPSRQDRVGLNSFRALITNGDYSGARDMAKERNYDLNSTSWLACNEEMGKGNFGNAKAIKEEFKINDREFREILGYAVVKCLKEHNFKSLKAMKGVFNLSRTAVMSYLVTNGYGLTQDDKGFITSIFPN